MKLRMIYRWRLWLLALGVVAATLMVAVQPNISMALPQYAAATGQSCAACHVNPAGGGARNAAGQAFAAIPTHSTDPAGAWAQVNAPSTPAPAPAPAPAAGDALSVILAGAISDDNVIYSVLVRNNTDKPVQNIYLAAAIPSGATLVSSGTQSPVGTSFSSGMSGVAAWLIKSVAARATVGPFVYTVNASSASGLSANAFAHWLQPTEGTTMSAQKSPISNDDRTAIEALINSKLNTPNNGLALWSLQAGTGPRMVDFLRDINLAWFAAQATNWEMALYELDDQFPSDLNKLALRNVGLAPSLANFQATAVKPVLDAIKAKDMNGFTAAYDNMTTACNSCHMGREDSKSIKIVRPAAPILPGIDFSGN